MAHYDADDYPYRHRDDDYHHHHDRPQARPRMSSNYTGANYLYPDPAGGANGLHRSRSQGHRPAPEIHIHNDMYQDNYQRAEAVSPPVAGARGRPAYRPEAEPVYYPVGVPQPQPVMVMGPGYSRSRSRSHSAADRRLSGDYYQSLVRVEELKRREAEQRAKDDQERAIADYERRKEREKDDQKRAVEKFAAEKRREEKEEEEAMRKWEIEQENKVKKKKEAEEEAVRKWQHEQEDKKKKEEQEELEWMRKQDEKKRKQKQEEDEWRRKLKEKEDKEKEKKKKDQEEEDEAVRKRLAKIGFGNNQIEAMIHADDKKKSKSTALAIVDAGRPVFPKIHREHLALETLKYYDLPWEYDRHNRDFIIILQEMDENETNVLFAHTRRLRERTPLTIEARKGDKPEYAWVRRRSKSRGKSPARREKLAEFVLRGP